MLFKLQVRLVEHQHSSHWPCRDGAFYPSWRWEKITLLIIGPTWNKEMGQIMCLGRLLGPWGLDDSLFGQGERYMHDSHSSSIHIIYVYIYMFTGVRIFLMIFLDVVSSQPILTPCPPRPPLLLHTDGSLTQNFICRIFVLKLLFLMEKN